jgi:hypothetical protein
LINHPLAYHAGELTEEPVMARVFDDLGKLIGYLDDPRCRGPIPGETRHIDFQGWRLRPDLPWQHMDPGQPKGLYQPKPMSYIFKIQVTNNANPEIDLFLRHDEVDFIRAHPSFRAP